MGSPWSDNHLRSCWIFGRAITQTNDPVPRVCIDMQAYWTPTAWRGPLRDLFSFKMLWHRRWPFTFVEHFQKERRQLAGSAHLDAENSLDVAGANRPQVGDFHQDLCPVDGLAGPLVGNIALVRSQDGILHLFNEVWLLQACAICKVHGHIPITGKRPWADHGVDLVSSWASPLAALEAKTKSGFYIVKYQATLFEKFWTARWVLTNSGFLNLVQTWNIQEFSGCHCYKSTKQKDMPWLLFERWDQDHLTLL